MATSIHPLTSQPSGRRLRSAKILRGYLENPGSGELIEKVFFGVAVVTFTGFAVWVVEQAASFHMIAPYIGH